VRVTIDVRKEIAKFHRIIFLEKRYLFLSIVKIFQSYVSVIFDAKIFKDVFSFNLRQKNKIRIVKFKNCLDDASIQSQSSCCEI
jgi:hypothetical protein